MSQLPPPTCYSDNRDKESQSSKTPHRFGVGFYFEASILYPCFDRLKYLQLSNLISKTNVYRNLQVLFV